MNIKIVLRKNENVFEWNGKKFLVEKPFSLSEEQA